MNAHTAKKLLKGELQRRGVGFSKLTAHTVDFTDLARERMVFVEIHGYEPVMGKVNWPELREFAKANGFRIETGVVYAG